MQETHDPRFPAPVAPPSAHPALKPSPTAAARPGFFLIVRKAIRLLFRRWLYVMALIFRWMRPAIGFIAVIVLLLGLLGWMSVQLWWPESASVPDSRVAALLPSSSVETFLKGQQAYDADLMWQSYSPDYQSAQLQEGRTKEALQSFITQLRMSGVLYQRTNYIGGVKLADGRSMYFYTVDVSIDSKQGTMSFVFTANTSGQIEKIDSPMFRAQ